MTSRYGQPARRSAAALLVLSVMAEPAVAQNIIAYPMRGQDQAVQNRDRYDCYNWAEQQTGFNPQAQLYGSSMPEPVERGGMFHGALGGSALGAVGGAIGGNAGEGAAIGAAVGGVFGGFRRRELEMRQAEMEQQQAAAHVQRNAGFNRAMAACMRGRGYSVD